MHFSRSSLAVTLSVAPLAVVAHNTRGLRKSSSVVEGRTLDAGCSLSCPLGGVSSQLVLPGDTCNTPVDFSNVTTVDGCPTACSIDGEDYVPSEDLGSSYMLQNGKHTITCSVMDGQFEPTGVNCTDTVRVLDLEAPELKCPSNITVSTACNATVGDGPYGDIVVKAIDECGLHAWADLICNDQNGATVTLVEKAENRGNIDNAQGYVVHPSHEFEVGTSEIVCRTVDSKRWYFANYATCKWSVNVVDTPDCTPSPEPEAQAPELKCPDSIEVEADAGKCYASDRGMFVRAKGDSALTVTCKDWIGGDILIVDPANRGNIDDAARYTIDSSHQFTIGMKLIHCTAVDESNNFAKCEFTVKVNENEEFPGIDC